MAEATRFKISAAVAGFVRPGVSVEQKLAGLEAVPSLGPSDRVTLIYCLMKDADAVVKQAATALFAELSPDVMLQYVETSDAHPVVLDAIARIHHDNPWIAQALLGSEMLSGPARQFLQGRTASTPVPPVSPVVTAAEMLQNAEVMTDDLGGAVPAAVAEERADIDEQLSEEGEEVDEEIEEEIEEVDEDGDKFLSKYKIAMIMGISEKIKMALSGDKEWRSILIKDSNKLVSGSVIKNPRITDGEILTILKVGVQNDEIIRLICANKEWTKNYMIRKALIDCPKTPLPNSLRYLATLNEKDIAGYAKSKNISSVLSTQAKRMLLSKKR